MINRPIAFVMAMTLILTLTGCQAGQKFDFNLSRFFTRLFNPKKAKVIEIQKELDANAAGQTNSTRPVITIYTKTPNWVGAPVGPHLLAAVWPDGRIVWSHDKTHGGKPLWHAKVDPAQVKSLLEDLEKDKIFSDRHMQKNYLVGDIQRYTIRLHHKNQNVTFHSCHELFERNPSIVVTAKSVESLEGRTREQVLAEQPADFRRFKSTWNKIRTAVRNWTPEKGKQYLDSTDFLYQNSPTD